MGLHVRFVNIAEALRSAIRRITGPSSAGQTARPTGWSVALHGEVIVAGRSLGSSCSLQGVVEARLCSPHEVQHHGVDIRNGADVQARDRTSRANPGSWDRRRNSSGSIGVPSTPRENSGLPSGPMFIAHNPKLG